MRTVIVSCLALATAAAAAPTRPSYDHQTSVYRETLQPVSVQGSVDLEVFFSPDHSIDTLTGLIQNAPEGSTIDVGTPGFDSWSFCTSFSGCQGCTVDKMKQESFPIFPAILNAVHERSCTVRLLTNNYDTATCTGKIAPLDWLSLNDGITVKYFNSVTFLHEKYIAVRPPAAVRGALRNSTGSATGRKTAISSVNWSYTSFLKNREAGVIVHGDNANGSKLLDMLDATFAKDWKQADDYVVNQTYSSSDMAIITSTDALPVTLPPQPSIPGEWPSPAPTVITTSPDSTTGVWTSPDYSVDTLQTALNASAKSIEVYIYQVTDDTLCNILLAKHQAGQNVTLVVSHDIFSKPDKAAAAQCYQKLYTAGLTPRLSPTFFTYSHLKIWIVDGALIGLSTGNWSPTDFNHPGYNNVDWPPYTEYPNEWQDTNRDIQFYTTDATVVDKFRTVVINDAASGTDYTPGW